MFSLSRRVAGLYNPLSSKIRLYSTSNYNYIQDLPTLSKKIDEDLSSNGFNDLSVLNAIKACQNLQKSYYNYNKFDQDGKIKAINMKIIEILSNENTRLTPELLKNVFLLKLTPKTNVKILDTFAQKNNQDYIPKDIALIPFRSSLFEGDLDSALKITDLTTGHKNYIMHRKKELKHNVLKFLSTTVGIGILSEVGVEVGLEFGYIDNAWASMTSLYAMVFAYVVNSSFFAAVVKFGRIVITGGGDYLTWQKGTFYDHWWNHADEILMCSKIVETDIALNGTGSASPELMEELCRTDETLNTGRFLKSGYTRSGKKVRLLAPKDNLNEIMLQAYWMTGGDGFEWVEPDQDPADIIWRNNLTKNNSGNLGSSRQKAIGWTDDLIESEKSVL